MEPASLRLCRSLLFVPAANPRAIDKARELDADMIVLDLEDSVKEADKAGARDAAVAAAAAGVWRPADGDPGQSRRARRIMAPTSSRFAGRRCDFIVLAKTETPKQAADAAWLMGKPVLAMIETPRGVIDAAAIAMATRGLIAGTNDLAATLGLPPESGRRGLVYALQRIVLAARAADAAAFDGVHNGLEADEAFRAECEEGPALRLRRQVGDPPEPDCGGQPHLRADRSRARGGAGADRRGHRRRRTPPGPDDRDAPCRAGARAARQEPPLTGSPRLSDAAEAGGARFS